MAKTLHIAVVSGVISALLLLFALALPLLALVLHLPLLFAGFIAGQRGVLVATGAAALLTMVTSGFMGVMVYMVWAGFSAIVVVHLLQRAADRSAMRAPQQFWSESYTLLCTITVIGLVIGSQALPQDSADTMLREIIALYETMAPDVPPAERLILAQEMLHYIPGAMAITWITTTLLNIALAHMLAQKITQTTSIDTSFIDSITNTWSDMRLPKFWDVAIAIMFILSYLPGLTGQLAQHALIPMIFGLLLAGLATVHKIASAHLSSPALAITGVYISLVLVTFLATPLLVGLGLADHLYRLRERSSAT